VDDKKDEGNAIGLETLMYYAARGIGKGIGGWLLVGISAASCILVNAASYAAELFSLQLIRPRPAEVNESAPQPGLSEGFKFIWGKPAVLWTIAFMGAVSLLGMQWLPMLTIYAAEIVKGGPHTQALLTIGLAIGNVAGSLLIANRNDSRSLRRGHMCGGIVFAASLFSFAMSSRLGWSMLFLFGVGFCSPLLIAGGWTYVFKEVPENIRGRVGSIMLTCVWGFEPLGYLAAGNEAARWGARETLVISACVTAMATTALIIFHKISTYTARA
jgi:predicted MFS family arabinose efflux permease